MTPWIGIGLIAAFVLAAALARAIKFGGTSADHGDEGALARATKRIPHEPKPVRDAGSRDATVARDAP